MGAERVCTLKLGRRKVQGKAHLESTEILFRGDDVRLKIPFSDMTRIVDRDGTLAVTFSGGTAVLELGADAERWANKIRNPKSVIEKLGIRPQHRVVVLHVSDMAFLAHLRERAGGVTVGRTAKDVDAIFLGAERLSGLDRMATLVRYLKRNGAIWTVTPKGKAGINDTDIIARGRAAGLVDVKVVAFSATHSANKFVVPKAQR
jgi:hypothetical protein